VDSKTLYTTHFALMGGHATVRFVASCERRKAEPVARAVEDEAHRIEQKFSRYREASVVSEINRNAGRTPVAVDAETEQLVLAALDLARITGGRFDPTVGVMRRVWDFSSGRIPSAGEVADLLPLVDASSVSVADGTVFLRRAGMELDLGGVGKEYAVDRAAGVLLDRGFTSAIVEFAGDVRTLGLRGDGRPWSVGVVDPANRRRCRFAVRIVGSSGVATSGRYERGFLRDGVWYHHLLDATTGWPAQGLASATVVGRSTSTAGCYATAAFLLGPDAGLGLLEDTEGIDGALITDAGEILTTSGMANLSDLPGSLYATAPFRSPALS
jgi:thiamine biosynthesis lipoprotein